LTKANFLAAVPLAHTDTFRHTPPARLAAKKERWGILFSKKIRILARPYLTDVQYRGLSVPLIRVGSSI